MPYKKKKPGAKKPGAKKPGPSKLSDFFDHDGSDPGTQYLFDQVIGGQNKSIDCHTAMFEVLMNALKLSSQAYRKELEPGLTIDFGNTETYDIPDQPTLDIILSYIPLELKLPTNRVLFEYARIEDEDWRTFSFYTNSPTTRADAEVAYKKVMAREYAKLCNLIRESYKTRATSLKLTLPDALTIDGTLTTGTVASEMTTLATWIRANIPPLKKLDEVTKATSIGTILDGIFDSSALAEDLLGILAIFLNAFRKATPKNPEAKNEVALLEYIRDHIGPGSYWDNHFSAYTKPVTDLTTISGSLKVAAVAKILHLWQQALSAPKSTAGVEIKKLLAGFAAQAAPGGNSAFLLERLRSALSNIYQKRDSDNRNLEEGAATLSKLALPEQIDTRSFELLKGAVLSALAAVPLAPKATFKLGPITKIRLFPFSNYNALEGKDGLEQKRDFDLASDDEIRTNNDAVEDGIPFYRPMLATVFDIAMAYKLQFYNLSNLKGNFFFNDASNPGTLILDPRLPKSTTISFRDFTIDGKKNDTNGKPYRTADRKADNFYATVKRLAKLEFSGRNSFNSLYQTDSKAVVTSHLIWRIPSGRGLNRTDHIEPSFCLWTWPGKIGKFEKLGKLLGLPEEREFVKSSATTLKLDRCTYDFKEYSIDSSLPNTPFRYEFIDIKKQGTTNTQTYVRVNIPHPNMPSVLASVPTSPATKTLEKDSLDILAIFNFNYYRRIDTVAGSPKILKKVQSGSNRPRVADGLPTGRKGVTDGKNFTEIGINLPLCFQIDKNILYFKDFARKRKTLKNKGSVLYQEVGKRADASKTMGDLFEYLKPALIAPQFRLPATQFTDEIFSKIGPVRDDWKALKLTGRGQPSVNQEWCHLQGHGDGGDERLGNFASGSYHCNTEQLAIEEGQRITTHVELAGTYRLRTTAYLFDDKGQIVGKNYLAKEATYLSLQAQKKALRKKEGKPPKADTDTGMTAPIAAFIRYKVYRDADAAGFQKYFDYIFEGQSETIDDHHFSILKHTVRFILAGRDLFEQWYKDEVAAADETAVAAKKLKTS